MRGQGVAVNATIACSHLLRSMRTTASTKNVASRSPSNNARHAAPRPTSRRPKPSSSNTLTHSPRPPFTSSPSPPPSSHTCVPTHPRIMSPPRTTATAMSTTAFATPLPARPTTAAANPASALCLRPAVSVSVLHRRRGVARLRMAADPPPSADDAESSSTTDTEAQQQQQQEEEDDESKTSASDILKTLREDSAADMAAEEALPEGRASRSMLGVYRDVDGKSNVWAVEPQEETDTRPQLSKTLIILIAAAFIVGTLLLLPLLPFTNPDQA